MALVTTPTVATTTFADMVPPISAYVRGCPSSVISSVVKRVVGDLCDRARVWREYGDATTLVPGTYEYTLTPASVTGEIITVYSAATTVAGVKHEIFYKHLDELQAEYPSWPEDADGDARWFTKAAVDTVMLAPVPDTAGTLVPYVALRPTPAATGWPTALYSAHVRVIFHGVLHDLMLMPERSWSDSKAAQYHGLQWTYLLNDSKASAERGFNTTDLRVRMRPMA